MPDIEMPDPEELGGLVTKPFKFVTGISLYSLFNSFGNDQGLTWCSRYAFLLLNDVGTHITCARLRRPLSQPEPDEALLAELR